MGGAINSPAFENNPVTVLVPGPPESQDPFTGGGWAGETGTPGPPRTEWSSQGRWSLSPFLKHLPPGLGRTSWPWGNPRYIPSFIPDGPSPLAGRPSGPPCSMCLEGWGVWLCCVWRWWWSSRWWRVWAGSAGLVSPWSSLSSAQSLLVKLLDSVVVQDVFSWWNSSDGGKRATWVQSVTEMTRNTIENTESVPI